MPIFPALSWCSGLYLSLSEVLTTFSLHWRSRVGSLCGSWLIIGGRLFISLDTIAPTSIISALRFALVSVKVVKEEVIVFAAVLKVIDNFLLLIDLYSEPAPIVEYVFIIIHIGLSCEVTTPCNYQLSFWLYFFIVAIDNLRMFLSGCLHHLSLSFNIGNALNRWICIGYHCSGKWSDVTLPSFTWWAHTRSLPRLIILVVLNTSSRVLALVKRFLVFLSTIASVSHLTWNSILHEA